MINSIIIYSHGLSGPGLPNSLFCLFEECHVTRNCTCDAEEKKSG